MGNSDTWMVFAFTLYLSCVTAELSSRLDHYETLHHMDINVRRRRSADDQSSHVLDLHFNAFGRSFDLILTPGSPVIAHNFKASVVYGDGSSSRFYINPNDFYNGHLAGQENVTADAFEEDGLWTANIYDKDEIYSIEPSAPHSANEPRLKNASMIVYKQSDVKWKSIYPDLEYNPGKRKICGGIHAEDEQDYNPEPYVEEDREKSHVSRTKRAAMADTCHIIAVADASFFRGPGGEFAHRTANSIIQSIQSVNNIYRNTMWNTDLQLINMGFQIKELRIHQGDTEPENYDRNGLHYNMKRDHWKDIDLLRQFGYDKDFHKFCLAHLFTHRRFAGGVLGLAYIASSRRETLGGICSNRRSGGRTLNTGFSSSMNTKGNNLLTQEAVLVTTHEFGHNWGAEHDAETSECAPSSFNDGKFVMYPYAVSGYEENNKKFSPCSKRYITSVLTAKSDRCFKGYQPNVPMCGNGIIDLGEDCDSGGFGLSGMDSCCSSDCKLIAGAECSPVNYECCLNCKIAPTGKKCRSESRETCRMAAHCTGYSRNCPASRHLVNTSCIDGGTCVDGECLHFCESEGKKINTKLYPCRCEQIDSACLRCCKTKHGACKPMGTNKLTDGRPCTFGYCEAGICKTGTGSQIQRLFTFIETLDSSTLVAFMKSNIVGTVIVFSLIVWIPASWVISCIDKRNEKEARQRELAWSHMLANRFEDYKVKESDYHRSTGRPLKGQGNNNRPAAPPGGDGDSNGPSVRGAAPAFKLNQPPRHKGVMYNRVPTRETERNGPGKTTDIETSI